MVLVLFCTSICLYVFLFFYEDLGSTLFHDQEPIIYYGLWPARELKFYCNAN